MSYYGYPPYQQYYAAPGITLYTLPPARHSTLGIASFAVGMLSALGMISIFVFAAALAVAGEHRINRHDDGDPRAVAIGATFILSALLAFVGAGLGVGGLLQRGRRRLFPILGVVVNLLMVLALFAMILAASAVRG